MIYLRYVLVFLTALLFSSCTTIAENIGFTGLVILSIVLLAIFGCTFYLIFTRRRNADKSLAQFSMSVSNMLDKFDNPENKIGALKALVKRINEDEKYKKDTTWRDQVLAKTYMHLATQYHSVGDVENTLQACTKILRLTPDDAMTLYNRGSLYSNMGQYDLALADLNRSIEIVDNYASSYNNRGTVYSKLGKDDFAFADFSKALELEESPTIYLNRGDAHKNAGNIAKAHEDYTKALELCDEHEESLKKQISKAMDSLSDKR